MTAAQLYHHTHLVGDLSDSDPAGLVSDSDCASQVSLEGLRDLGEERLLPAAIFRGIVADIYADAFCVRGSMQGTEALVMAAVRMNAGRETRTDLVMDLVEEKFGIQDRENVLLERKKIHWRALRRMSHCVENNKCPELTCSLQIEAVASTFTMTVNSQQLSYSGLARAFYHSQHEQPLEPSLTLRELGEERNAWFLSFFPRHLSAEP